MLAIVRTLLTRWFGPSRQLDGFAARATHVQTETVLFDVEARTTDLVPYDESLLERARTQWQFGDWESLAKLERDMLQHHPDRAKLALLAAAGHLQTNNTNAARQFIRLAQDWGCSNRLVSQILVAGVHNSLGRAAAVAGLRPRAIRHFESAITLGAPGSDVRLLTQARVGEQFSQLGLSSSGTSAQHISAVSSSTTVLPAPIVDQTIESIKGQLKEKIKTDIDADVIARPNFYVHNRSLTPALNKAICDFAEEKLKRDGLKPAYINYLAAKAIQIEGNCVGRLATTVQDAVARQLVAECVPGERLCILEIGALYGISLAILYNHGITRYQQVQIVCLDPFDGYYGQAVDAVLNQPVNELTFLRNMRLANVPPEDYGLIRHYSTDPAAVAAASRLRVNLLMIDGDHSYEGVKFDFDKYFPLVQPGGYVVFDDYNDSEYPGVQEFVDEDLRKTPDIEYLGAISRTAVARKRGLAAA